MKIEELDKRADEIVNKYSNKSKGKKELFNLIILQDILKELKEIKKDLATIKKKK